MESSPGRPLCPGCPLHNSVSLSQGFPPIPHRFQTEPITCTCWISRNLKGSGALKSWETSGVRPGLQEAPLCTADTRPGCPRPHLPPTSCSESFPPALLAGNGRQGGSHPGCSHHPGVSVASCSPDLTSSQWGLAVWAGTPNPAPIRRKEGMPEPPRSRPLQHALRALALR